MATYTLTINTNTIALGSVTPASGSTYDSTGSHTPTITATPEAGCRFAYWTGALTGSVNPTTLHMSGNLTVNAWFAVDEDSDIAIPVPSVSGSFDPITPTKSIVLPAPSVVESDVVVGSNDIDGAILKEASPLRYTDYTTEANEDTANDVVLLLATPAVNDAFFFGVDDIGDNELRYVINIGTAGVGTWTIHYYYWNGAWTALPTGNILLKSAQFIDFKTSGFGSLWIMPPGDWATVAVNGVTQYWLEARVTSYSARTTIPLATRIYQSPVTYATDWKKSLFDSLSFTENISKDFSKPVNQSFSLSDTFSRTLGSVRSLVDNLSLSDLYSKIWTSKRNVNNPLSLTDSERKNISKQLVEDINFSDVFVGSWVKLLVLSDLQVLADNTSYSWQSKKNIQDHIDFIEAHGVYFEKRLFTNFSLRDIVSAYIPPKLYLFIADKLGTDSSLVKFFNKSLNDIGSLNEIKEFVVGKNFSDYMNLHDMRFLVSTLIRNISDSISLSDIKKLSIGKPVSDSVGVSEDRSISAIKGIIDNLSLSDIFSHISSFSKSIADNVSVLDSYTREWIAKRNIVESFTLQETKEVDYKKSSADYLSLDDSYSKLIGKNLNDSSSLFDTLSTAWTVLKSIADNASLSDLNFFSVKKNIDDSTGLVDFFLYVRGRYLSLSDLQVFADNITKGIFKSEQEQINFIDYHGVYMEKRTLDNLNLRDVFTSYMQGFLSIAEGVSVTDNVKKVFNKVMLSAESLLDNIIKKYSKNLYDIVSLGDTTLLYMNNTYYISMFNKIDLYDAIAKRIILYKDDNLSLIAELQKDGYLALQDNITLTDHLSMKVMKVLGEVIPITDDITQLLESEPFYFDHGLVEPVFVIEDLRVYGGAEMHFYPEQAVDVRWKTRYFVNDLLFDPDSHEITVFDPKGVVRVVNNPAYIIKESIGVYKYTFNIPADVVSGDWRVKIKGIKATWVSVLNIHLEVRKT